MNLLNYTYDFSFNNEIPYIISLKDIVIDSFHLSISFKNSNLFAIK